MVGLYKSQNYGKNAVEGIKKTQYLLMNSFRMRTLSGSAIVDMMIQLMKPSKVVLYWVVSDRRSSSMRRLNRYLASFAS